LPASDSLPIQASSLWYSERDSHNESMINNTSSHTPFAQLPVETRELFFVYATAALASHRCQPPTPAELTPELEVVWNSKRLVNSDLSEPDRITQLLKHHFGQSGTGVTTTHSGHCGRRYRRASK